MKMRNVVFATLLAIPTSSFAQTKTTPTTPPAAPTSPTTPTTPTDKPATGTKTTEKAKPAKLVEAEIAIVAHVHHINLMEISMGKLGQQKGTAAVKRYGETLVRDHQTADKELAAFAKKRGVAKIPAYKPMNEADKADHAAMMDGMKKLKALKGEDFDRAYLQMMVEGHDKELAKSDPAIALATDTELKTMLEARKPVLQRHADAARELQKGNAQAGASTGTTTPGTATSGTAKTGTGTGTTASGAGKTTPTK